MKNLVIRTVFTLTFLLTLVAIFAGVNPAPAHADSPPPIHRVDCSSEVGMEIITDFNQNKDCFDGIGTIQVMLYNVSQVCKVPNFPNISVSWQDDGRDPATTVFPSSPAVDCFDIDNGNIPHGNFVNQVHSISIGNN